VVVMMMMMMLTLMLLLLLLMMMIYILSGMDVRTSRNGVFTLKLLHSKKSYKFQVR